MLLQDLEKRSWQILWRLRPHHELKPKILIIISFLTYSRFFKIWHCLLNRTIHDLTMQTCSATLLRLKPNTSTQTWMSMALGTERVLAWVCIHIVIARETRNRVPAHATRRGANCLSHNQLPPPPSLVGPVLRCPAAPSSLQVASTCVYSQDLLVCVLVVAAVLRLVWAPHHLPSNLPA